MFPLILDIQRRFLSPIACQQLIRNPQSTKRIFLNETVGNSPNGFIFASTYDVTKKRQRRECFEAGMPGIADRCTKRYRGAVYT